MLTPMTFAFTSPGLSFLPRVGSAPAADRAFLTLTTVCLPRGSISFPSQLLNLGQRCLTSSPLYLKRSCQELLPEGRVLSVLNPVEVPASTWCIPGCPRHTRNRDYPHKLLPNLVLHSLAPSLSVWSKACLNSGLLSRVLRLRTTHVPPKSLS